MKKTKTTAPTECRKDQELQPPAARHITRALTSVPSGIARTLASCALAVIALVATAGFSTPTSAQFDPDDPDRPICILYPEYPEPEVVLFSDEDLAAEEDLYVCDDKRKYYDELLNPSDQVIKACAQEAPGYRPGTPGADIVGWWYDEEFQKKDPLGIGWEKYVGCYGYKAVGRPAAGEPVFGASLDAPGYALAGTELTYQLSVTNTGSGDANDVSITLTWDQTDLQPFPSADNCSGSPLTCSWQAEIAKEGEWDTELTVTVPSIAALGDVIDAQLSVTHAASGATGSASAATTVDGKPDLVVVLSSSPRRGGVVAPGGEVEMTMTIKNVGTALAKNVVLTLPTSTATFASASNNGAASGDGDDVVWPAIATLAASDETTTYTATLTAGADGSGIMTQASLTGTTENGDNVGDTSHLITLRVANEADPVLTAAFDPENFVPSKDIALTFTVANEGSALLNAGTLVVPLPKDTSVATVPTGATCSATACTLPVAALAAGGSTTATVPLTVDAGSRLDRLAGSGELKPDTVEAFSPLFAGATADLQITSDIKEPYEITIDPPAGSGCSLTSVSTQQDAGVSGVTLVRDKLLNFSISGCDPGTAVPVAITVQGDALPEGTVAIKADDSGVSGAQITDATITGNTIRYTLTDNGSLDLDPDDGELRDPVAVAIVGGSGIYVPFIPVPIPYWVLGLLAGLMGWLGFRRLSAA